mgnify:CR=1 FL=1
MAINFPNYDTTNRVPGVYFDTDASQANTATTDRIALIVAQQLSSGTMVANTPVLCEGWADTVAKAGAGSLLEQMVADYRAYDSFTELWLLPLADDPAAVAASGSISFTSAATAAGTLPVRINDRLVRVGGTAGMTAAQLATAVQAAIAVDVYMPGSATVATSTVTLTAKNKGLVGNDIQITIADGGTPAGESVPAGVAYTITAMTGGATNPVLTTALTNLADKKFSFIHMPYADATSITAMESFLEDRWSWQKQLYGLCLTAMRGSLGQLTTFSATRNDKHVFLIGFNGSRSWAPSWVAQMGAKATYSLRLDPAQPLQTLATGLTAPPLSSRFALSDRNTLLHHGVGTYKVAADGTVQIERLVSLYQTNAAGAADDSWLDINTNATLEYVHDDLRTFLETQFVRKVLVDDDQTIPGGSNRVNTKTVKAAILSRYKYLQDTVGVVQNYDAFAAALQVENAGGGLLSVLCPEDLANQLYQIAILAQFRKS